MSDPPPRARRLGQVMVGTIAGQLATFAAAPVLARMYSPEAFGLLGVFSALVMILSTVLALRLEQAVPLPRANADAASVVGLGLSLIVFSTSICTLVAWKTSPQLANLLGQPLLRHWLLLVPITAGITSAFVVLNQYAVRQGRFRAIGARNFLQATATVFTQVSLGVLQWRPGGLLIGLGCGQAVGAVTVAFGSGLRRAVAEGCWSPRRLAALFRQYRSLALWLTPAGLLNALGVHAPLLLVSVFFGETVTGWFGLTQRVLWAPMLLLGTAVAQVYLNEAAQRARDDLPGLHRLFVSTSRRLLVAGMVICVPLAVAGPWAFSLAFGQRWETAGLFAALLAPGLLAQIVAFPLSQTLIVVGMPRKQALWDTVRLAAVVLSIVVPAMAGLDAAQTIACYSFASVVTFILAWWMCWRAVSPSTTGALTPANPHGG